MEKHEQAAIIALPEYQELRDAIGAKYEALVGYNPFTDDPTMTTEDGKALLDEVTALHLASAALASANAKRAKYLAYRDTVYSQILERARHD